MDVNRLKAILDKSKTIMTTVDAGQYKKGQVDANLLKQEMVESVNGVAPTRNAPKKTQQQLDPNSDDYRARIQNSKMPDAVKKAMLNNPIELPKMPGIGESFTLEDLGYSKQTINEQVQQPAPIQQPAPQQFYQQPQQYFAPQAPTTNRDEIKSIIKECLAEMMVDTISEHTVKNTIRTLMNEGKIRVKKTTPPLSDKNGRKAR